MTKRKQSLRVAMISPPWLAMPIKGYGGIELVLETLIKGLLKLGVEVEVFGNGQRKIRGIKTHSIYKKEQYEYIHLPIYHSMPIIAAHMQYSLAEIVKDGKFDIIHDNNGIIGPQMLAWATKNNKNIPPAVYTHHGPPFAVDKVDRNGLPTNHYYWDQLAREMGKVFMVGISDSMMKKAPRSLSDHILPTVHNAIEVEGFPYRDNKLDYYITLARFARDKGQHIAAKLCAKKKYKLRMAGTISGISTNQKLMTELSNPQSIYRSMDDFNYYSDKVLPYTLKYKKITYSGNLSGFQKMRFVSEAKALLFPIDWEEPFGMAVIEALACGTPVVAMKRGAMPEIIEHGVNGFLAENEEEFSYYMDKVNEIDPAACRSSVEKNFSSDVMAEKYVDRYIEVISRVS